MCIVFSAKDQKTAKKKNNWKKAIGEQCTHTFVTCLFFFSFAFRGIPSIQIPGLSTSCTVKSKHHSFWASLFMSLCRHLLEFWTLVRVCLGSRGHCCRHSHCSIQRSQLQSPPPQICRHGWCHLRTVPPPPFPGRPASARPSGRVRKRVITRCGLSLSYRQGDTTPCDNTRLRRIWLAVRYYTANKQLANKLEKYYFSPRSWEILKFMEDTIKASRTRLYYTWELPKLLQIIKLLNLREWKVHTSEHI